ASQGTASAKHGASPLAVEPAPCEPVYGEFLLTPPSVFDRAHDKVVAPTVRSKTGALRDRGDSRYSVWNCEIQVRSTTAVKRNRSQLLELAESFMMKKED